MTWEGLSPPYPDHRGGPAVGDAWSDYDPRDRPRPRSEAVASIPCGLFAGSLPCVERFFNEEGRDLHLEEEHGPPSDFATINKREALNEESGTRPRRSRVMWWDK